MSTQRESIIPTRGDHGTQIDAFDTTGGSPPANKRLTAKKFFEATLWPQAITNPDEFGTIAASLSRGTKTGIQAALTPSWGADYRKQCGIITNGGIGKDPTPTHYLITDRRISYWLHREWGEPFDYHFVEKALGLPIGTLRDQKAIKQFYDRLGLWVFVLTPRLAQGIAGWAQFQDQPGKLDQFVEYRKEFERVLLRPDLLGTFDEFVLSLDQPIGEDEDGHILTLADTLAAPDDKEEGEDDEDDEVA